MTDLAGVRAARWTFSSPMARVRFVLLPMVHLPSPSETESEMEERYEEFIELIGNTRNKKLVQQLRSIHDEHHDEELRVGVVWGARHMLPVIRALRTLGYRPTDSQWMTVFTLDE